MEKIKPDENASGDHTTFLEDIFGFIFRYATYIRNLLNPSGFDEVKRVDLIGAEHFNKKDGEDIETPHVHGKDIPGGVRRATDDEIPNRNKRMNQND